MEKSGSLAAVSQVKPNRKNTKPQTDRFVIPNIPASVNLNDFAWDAPVDLEAALRLSEKKGRK